jgi:hypothetical protein
MSQTQDSDPHQVAARIARMLEEVSKYARENVRRVEDPRAQALFETTAEVLTGLRTAYTHFEQRSEPPWR